MIKNKIKIWLFFIIFLFYQIGTPFLFAAGASINAQTPQCGPNASICMQTPESLNLYLEFQRKAIALMAEDPFQTHTEQINAIEGGLFTNKILKRENYTGATSPLLTDLLQELEVSLKNMAIGTITSSALFLLSAMSTLADNTMGFLILFQERPIVRDRAKLLDIDRSISDTTYILGQKGKIGQKIKDTTPIKNLITKYQQNGLLDKNSTLSDQMTYLEILSELQALNISVKKFLASNTTNNIEKKERMINLSDDLIKKLNADYTCARFTLGFVCNSNYERLNNNLETLLSNTKRTSQSAGHTINQAINKLTNSLKGFKNFRSSTNPSISIEELELLRSVYGLDTSKFTNERLSSLSPISLSQRTRNYFKGIKMNVTSYEKKKEEQNLQILNQEANKTITNNTNPELIQTLSNALTTIYTNNQNIQYEIQASNTITISNEFSILSHKIQNLSNTIGDKQEGMRALLDAICNYQCQNHQSKTCYIL